MEAAGFQRRFVMKPTDFAISQNSPVERLVAGALGEIDRLGYSRRSSFCATIYRKITSTVPNITTNLFSRMRGINGCRVREFVTSFISISSAHEVHAQV